MITASKLTFLVLTGSYTKPHSAVIQGKNEGQCQYMHENESY